MRSCDAQLVAALRTTADELAQTRSVRDPDRTLAHIVLAAVRAVPGADDGGISVRRGDTVVACHPTAPHVAELDRLQGELDEGPCITALEDASPEGVVVAADLDGVDAGRWPRFASAAVAAGVRAMLSTRVSMDGDAVASVNLYASRPGVFDDAAQLLAGLVAAQGALLLHGSHHAALLTEAVENRDVIGQAKGLLMERFHVDDEEAFRMLKSSSQETNLKLVDVARWMQQEARDAARTSRASHSTSA
ncbi:transcriptional regulator [Actinomycetospora sp. NBRC 106375]|uniref:GAF and ANTAR domain-containing protein n=1 Tax=Actinomycetospora sp. NBRC 106375 TaxID=3032207 RepID=UPI0024A2BA72|nr:GAF and ANTAR domain-containing protein [Actinomycetospora sp. NBRC 106375]GLZ44691.1 transcriptional regulator [Actinomycetospora sp. NBRC 106375]